MARAVRPVGRCVRASGPTIDAMEDTVIGPWRRRSRRIAYENPWITVWHDEVTRPDGAAGVYGVVHFANVAVGVVAVDYQDRVLLVGQHRYSLDAYSWEIPEGGVPFDEDPLEGARRELREETGYEAASWTELLRFELSNSVSDERGVVFLAQELTSGVARPDGTEELAVRWAPFDDVVAMIASGEMTDALSQLGVLKVAVDRSRPASGRRRR
jgi:8-oxo-dGTP pyrophosphatase MutT (NUDIX family)